MKSICVYCGSSSGNDPEFANSATTLGKYLASQKIRLVYGGGDLGLMGLVSKTVLDNGGTVLGVLPKPFLKVCTVPEDTEFVSTILCDDMHSRKQTFLKNSDAFVCLPGGFGTFEELLECITWKQLGIHHKPIVVFDPCNFFKPMVDMFIKAESAGFIRRIDLVHFCSTIDQVARILDQVSDAAEKEKGMDLEWKLI